MKKVLLYGHGGSYNHGAEAIIRTTVYLVREKYPDAHIILASHFPEQDMEYGLPVDEIAERDSFFVDRQRTEGTHHLYNEEIYRQAIQRIDADTVCLSVGGDNYCYGGWQRWNPIIEKARMVGAKNIMWCCSINPDGITDEMAEVLNSYDAITVRENATYRELERWVKPDRVTLVKCADSAFLLEPEPVDFSVQNSVAMNLSPLIFRTAGDAGMLRRNVECAIRYICEELGMNLVLVPHVMMPTDNDYELLKGMWETSPYREKMFLLPPDYSASQYKYVISKCRFGVFARTHAAIAAYSSQVPTVVLGYSVKARGIADDLGMGHFILDNNHVVREGQLRELVGDLLKNEHMIRNKLKDLSAEIRYRAMQNSVVL